MSSRPAAAVWCFDLDGCLVDSMAATDLRPHARELLSALVNRGVSVHIWSAGGAEYAGRVARGLEIDQYVTAFHDKERQLDGRWLLPPFADASEVICVDDQPEGLPAGVRSIVVFPYIGVQRHDQVFARLLGELDA